METTEAEGVLLSFLTLTNVLKDDAIRSNHRNENLRAQLDGFITSVTCKHRRALGLAPDVVGDILTQAKELAHKCVEDLLEKCKCDSAEKRHRTFENEQELDTRSRKRWRSNETDPGDQSFEEDKQTYEDSLVNDSVNSPLRATINRRGHSESEEEEESVVMPSAAARGGEHGLQQRGQVGVASLQRHDVDDNYSENESSTSSGASARSAITASSAASLDVVPSVIAKPKPPFPLNIDDVKADLENLQNDLKTNGAAAGNIEVPKAIRVILEVAFAAGKQGNVFNILIPFLQLLHNMTATARAEANRLRLKANELEEAANTNVVNIEESYSRLLCRLGTTATTSDDIAVECKNSTVARAIDIYNARMKKKKRRTRFCAMSRSLQNLVKIYLNTCVTIMAMSRLCLEDFCCPELRRLVDALLQVMPNFSRDSIYEMHLRQFFEDVITQALTSENIRKVTAAVRVVCMLRELMIDERIRLAFDEAQRMRLDAQGECEGPDYCGGTEKTQLDRRTQMLNLYFCLILGRQIQDEFDAGFFDKHGTFVRTILRGAWTDVRDNYHQFSKLEFFRSLFKSNYDNTKNKENMEKLIAKTADDRMELVVTDTQHMKSIQQIFNAAFQL